jgi:hypothetical protein
VLHTAYYYLATVPVKAATTQDFKYKHQRNLHRQQHGFFKIPFLEDVKYFFPAVSKSKLYTCKISLYASAFLRPWVFKTLQDCVKKKNTEYLPLLDLSDSAISLPILKIFRI